MASQYAPEVMAGTPGKGQYPLARYGAGYGLRSVVNLPRGGKQSRVKGESLSAGLRRMPPPETYPLPPEPYPQIPPREEGTPWASPIPSARPG